MSISAPTTNVQTRQRRGAVRCRRCGQVLTAATSIAAGIGSDCRAVETSGAVPAGKEWTLQIGDWVTWDVDGDQFCAEIVGRDGLDPKRYMVELDDAGEPGEIVSVSKYWLTFVGVERPRSESEQRRRRIIETAVQNRTGGLAIVAALADTPHQAAFALRLQDALFPDGDQEGTA